MMHNNNIQNLSNFVIITDNPPMDCILMPKKAKVEKSIKFSKELISKCFPILNLPLSMPYNNITSIRHKRIYYQVNFNDFYTSVYSKTKNTTPETLKSFAKEELLDLIDSCFDYIPDEIYKETLYISYLYDLDELYSYEYYDYLYDLKTLYNGDGGLDLWKYLETNLSGIPFKIAFDYNDLLALFIEYLHNDQHVFPLNNKDKKDVDLWMINIKNKIEEILSEFYNRNNLAIAYNIDQDDDDNYYDDQL